MFFSFSQSLSQYVQSNTDCTCEQSETSDRNKTESLKLKLVAIASILVFGAIGISLPILGKFIPAFCLKNNAFFLIKAFAAGVILSTGFVRVLPDASESLTSLCLKENPWGRFPFTVNALNKARLEANVRVYGEKNYEKRWPSPFAVACGVFLLLSFLKHFYHPLRWLALAAVALGIFPIFLKALAALRSFTLDINILMLLAALQANFKPGTIATMAIFFSLTTPIGILIGLGISNIYNKNSPTTLIVEGLFNSAPAGILIYMALVPIFHFFVPFGHMGLMLARSANCV